MKFQKMMDVASSTQRAPVLQVRVNSSCALDETCLLAEEEDHENKVQKQLWWCICNFIRMNVSMAPAI